MPSAKLRGKFSKQPRNGYIGSSYATSGTSNSEMPLIKLRKGLKHKRNKLIQLDCNHCTFYCLYRSTMAGIKTAKYYISLLLIA